ncbi:MAG: efflux RND transporter permease subunit [Planctomycetes bacterium]|nr:efflux RND transporter permease subunit [Planctomycetota bacterium]
MNIIETSLKNRFLVILALVGIVGFGIYQYRQLPVDAFPDISPIMVPIFAEAHGMAPEEVERLVSYPIESAMNGLPQVTLIKSTSAFGLSVVYVYFEDSVDIYFARQVVSERLNEVRGALPPMDTPPSLGPISTGLGQIFIYYLAADPNVVDTGGKDTLTYLRELNDWQVKFQLQTVPGVTSILSMGGHVLQYQIRLDPVALARWQIGLDDIVEAVQANNENVGGQFLVLGREEYLVRGIGLIESLEDIRQIKIKTIDGVPIRLAQVAEIEFGKEVRRGVVSRNGKEEVVSGLVLKLFGENTSHVIERLYAKLPEVQKALPAGVRLIPYYEQAELVSQATWTVQKALLEGGGLAALVLVVCLGSIRAALIVAMALPFSALVAFIFMQWFGMSANLMSLGGVAVAMGMLVDGAIVVTENLYRHMSEAPPDLSAQGRLKLLIRGTGEVARPITFALFIMVLVFAPVLTLQGVEGKMFRPMAFTMCFALVGSLIAAIVAVPSLVNCLLKTGKHKEPIVMVLLQKLYDPVLGWALRHRCVVLILVLVTFLGSVAVIPFLGTEFVPTLEEGSILIGVTMAPSISLVEATRTIQAMERDIIAYPEVEEVVSRIGRPQAGSHPHPVNYAEVHIELHPLKQWTRFQTKDDLIASLNEKLAVYAGTQLNFTQPIQNVFDELLSGVRAEIAIKLFGEDLGVLRSTAQEIRNAIDNIPGLVDLSTEQSFGQPQVQIIADRDACARYGINVADVLELVEMAIGGEVVDQIYLGTRRFGIHVRYQEPYRDIPEVLEDLLVRTADGTQVPLKQVARIEKVIGPVQINREANQRRWIVQGNVRGRDLGGVIADIQQRIADQVELPPGYTIEYGGQFENQQRAMKRLSIIVPMVIALVFIMLCMAFGSVPSALLVIMGIPLSVIGGVFGLFFMGEYLSVPAAVGCIALFGVSVQDSIVMVSRINQLRQEGRDLDQAVLNGCHERFRPVMITTLTTVLGLLPLLVAQGIGSEVQRPLATVVVFGLTSSTLLTIFVIPVFYRWFRIKIETQDLQDNGT